MRSLDDLIALVDRLIPDLNPDRDEVEEYLGAVSRRQIAVELNAREIVVPRGDERALCRFRGF